MEHAHRLHRSSDDKIFVGIAGGMAEYFDIDPVFVRLAWALVAVLSGGVAIIVYLAMAFIVPSQQTDADHSEPSSTDEDAADEFEPAREGERRTRRTRTAFIAGIMLIVVGFLFLFSNLGWFGNIRWEIVWPVAMIVIGLAVLVSRLRG